MSVDLTLTINEYDRIQPIVDGDVQVEGVDLDILNVTPGELFWQLAHHPDQYVLTEQSLSTHVLWTSKGDNPYVGIPAFPSRFFRHSGVFLPAGSDIEEPADLKGKTVGGWPEYQTTAVTMIRGMLDHEYDVAPTDMTWYTEREEKRPLELPSDLDLSVIPPEKSLYTMLENGEIDAMFSPVLPQSLGDKVKRLWPDFKHVEMEYYEQTNVYPIMHLICLHREVHEQHPWIAMNLYQAMTKAKNMAMDRLYDTGGAKVTLPWITHHIEETREVLGDDYWPYGYQDNYDTLDAVCQFSYEHGLSDRRVDPSELFLDDFITT
jgi:4,5-dihydroxyphthalate decarboxylase